MNLTYIKEFVLLAERLSYTETANLLFISQSTLSKHISDLEKEMGIMLFSRNRHTVELTDIGKEVYVHCQRIIKECESLDAALDSYKQTVSGRFRFGALYYAVETFAHPILLKFSEKYPDVQPQLFYYQPLPLVEALEKNEIDLAVTNYYSHARFNEFECIVFCNEPSVIVCESRHPLSKKGCASINELKDETFVILRARPYAHHVIDLLKSCGIEDPNIEYCDQIDALDMTIKKCHGISIMPASLKIMNRQNIVYLPVENDDCVFPVCALYKKENNNPSIAKILGIIKRMYK